MFKPCLSCSNDYCIKSGLSLAVNALSKIAFARIRSCRLLAMVPLIRTQCWLHRGGSNGDVLVQGAGPVNGIPDFISSTWAGVFTPFLQFPWYSIHQLYH
jgi:hypothetical protein